VDKQRLLELAGITEAKYAAVGTVWILVLKTIEIGHRQGAAAGYWYPLGEDDVKIVGPFHSRDSADDFAKKLIDELANQYNLDIEPDVVYEIKSVSPSNQVTEYPTKLT